MCVRIPFEGGEPGGVQDSTTGWLTENDQHWGRPVGLVTGQMAACWFRTTAEGAFTASSTWAIHKYIGFNMAFQRSG
jgi:hypothetical protein